MARQVTFRGTVAAFMATCAAFGAVPKVGVTIALRSGYGPQQYLSNAMFKTRPVAEQMAKDGIDLCWYEGWKKGADPAESLRQFNCVWLITEHEDECPLGADEVGAALRAYVESGGGLLVSHSAGRYPEASVDAFWAKAFSYLGIEMLHEEIADFSTRRQDDRIHKQAFFYADTKADHPVVAGVAGLWLPMRGGYPSHCWSAPAAKFSAGWEAVLSTSPTGRSYVKNRRTNFVEWTDSNAGFYRRGAPIVAVRALGRGRIVFEAVHKDCCGWMYGIDKWPNYVERGVLFGRRSDSLRLAENALFWASEPSLGDKSFTAGYRPVEPREPPYRRIDAGPTPDEKPVWSPLAVQKGRRFAAGVAGLRSTHSDGKSTVAEYADAAKRLGLGFIVFADDLAQMSEEGLMRLRAECAAVSDDSFYACPGVEHIDMDGLRWIVCHDKIEYPKKDFLRDGRVYEVMKDGIVMQRNFYGHQNLYRGAVLNTPRIAEAGIDQENFADFNCIVPRAYDVDRLMWDNVAANKRFSANLHLVYPLSFTRVRSAAELPRAAAASVTCIDSLAGMRAVTGNKGAYAWSNAVKHGMFVRCGGDVSLDGFAARRVPGTDIFQIAVAASSSAGLAEILVDDDGGDRIVARFDEGGAKSASHEFALPLGRQTHLVVTVRDRAGNTAHGVPQRLSYQHAGLNRCSDNSNLLSQNPNVMFSTNWDDKMLPCWKFLCRPPRHWHFSEAFAWEEYGSNPSRIPSSRMDSQLSRVMLKGVDYPSEEKGVMPSAQMRFPLIAPNSVAILDQILGAKVMTPTRGPDRATYGFGSIQMKVADGRYWRRRHRVYQFTDRIDSWWRAVWQRVVGAYRGGYVVCEGEIEFTEDVELASPVRLCSMDTENPVGGIETFGRSGEVAVGRHYATVADPSSWHAWFPLAGTDPLSVREERAAARVVSHLEVGKPRAYRRGERIRYRFATGSFVEPPREGLYLDWFAGMMDGSRFRHDVLRGKERGVSGILDVSATDGVAEVELGPTWFIQDYPVRVEGLADNGSAYAVDDAGTLYRPLGFADGKAYVELPLERRRRWRLMNVISCDAPGLRFVYIPPMPGHDRPETQVLNTTKRRIAAKVRNNLSGEEFLVDVPAGSIKSVMKGGIQ